MALPRKGSRNITVDGTTYRWRLRRRPTYSQALAWSPCTYAVEHADEAGTTLVVTTDHPHPSNWLGHEPKPVLPSDVKTGQRKQRYELTLRRASFVPWTMFGTACRACGGSVGRVGSGAICWPSVRRAGRCPPGGVHSRTRTRRTWTLPA